MAVKVQFNPSTLKVMWTTATNKVQLKKKECLDGSLLTIVINGVLECPSGDWPNDCNGTYNNFTLVYIVKDRYGEISSCIYQDYNNSKSDWRANVLYDIIEEKWTMLLWYGTSVISDNMAYATSDVGDWQSETTVDNCIVEENCGGVPCNMEWNPIAKGYGGTGSYSFG